MRRFLNFTCEGNSLAATLDEADGPAGLLIVSGGNEIRIGAHRGMDRLARDIASAGYSSFRFDRRGIGDSEGENGGFEGSAADLQAAVNAFRSAIPGLRRIVAFGNCDAATALLIHQPDGLDSLVLSNIWVIEPTDDLPPPAAIKSHYLDRMKDPKAWLGLLTGAVNFRKIASGLMKITAPSRPSALADRVAQAMADGPADLHILLAKRDGTALAFAEAWNSDTFAKARAIHNHRVTHYDSSAHSFSREADYALLKSTILEQLSRS